MNGLTSRLAAQLGARLCRVCHPAAPEQGRAPLANHALASGGVDATARPAALLRVESDLIAAGCDVVTVQRAQGHAKATMTLETHSHLWPSAGDRPRPAAATLVEEVLQNVADYLRTTGPN
jgi:hypothetical protein